MSAEAAESGIEVGLVMAVLEVAHQCDSLEDAISHFDQALKMDPNMANVHFSKGLTLQLLADGMRDGSDKIGKYREAAESYRKAIELQMDSVELYCHLGDVLLQLNEVDEAKALYQKVVEVNPNFGLAHYGLGNSLMQLKQYQEAILAYEKAIEPQSILPVSINPILAGLYVHVGSLNVQGKKYQEGYEYYVKAVNANLDDDLAFNLLCGIRLHYREYITIVDDDPTNEAFSCSGADTAFSGHLADVYVVVDTTQHQEVNAAGADCAAFDSY